MTSRTIRQGKPFTGKKMLALTVAFFGVVIGVNVAMATLAETTWTGLVVDNTYVASNAFQAKQDAWKKQLELGWKSELSYDGERLIFELRDGSGRLVDLTNVSVHLHHPIGTAGDRILTLKANGAEHYFVDVELELGAWVAVIDADDTSVGPFEAHKRFLVAGTK